MLFKKLKSLFKNEKDNLDVVKKYIFIVLPFYDFKYEKGLTDFLINAFKLRKGIDFKYILKENLKIILIDEKIKAPILVSIGAFFSDYNKFYTSLQDNENPFMYVGFLEETDLRKVKKMILKEL